MVFMVSEGGRFIHGSRAFRTAWLLLLSLFPLGEVFSQFIQCYQWLPVKVSPFTYPPLWDLHLFVCNLSGWKGAHREESPLSCLSRALLIPWGEDFLSEIRSTVLKRMGILCHRFEPWTFLLDVMAMLIFAHPRQFPASCVLSPFSLNMCSSIVQCKSLCLTHSYQKEECQLDQFSQKDSV